MFVLLYQAVRAALPVTFLVTGDIRQAVALATGTWLEMMIRTMSNPWHFSDPGRTFQDVYERWTNAAVGSSTTIPQVFFSER